jgi:hypothetical protein
MLRKYFKTFFFVFFLSAGALVWASQSQTLEDIWKILLSVKYKYNKDAYVPIFEAKHKALDGQEVTLRGYMYPLEEASQHSFFMLSYYPVNICFFCGGAGPESVVEITAKKPINFTNKPLYLKGKLKLNSTDPERLFYILLDAEQVSQ